MGIYDYKINAIDDELIQVEIKKNDWGEIQERLDFLDALEAQGVDNWDGYSEAQREVYGDDDEDDEDD